MNPIFARPRNDSEDLYRKAFMLALRASWVHAAGNDVYRDELIEACALFLRIRADETKKSLLVSGPQ